VTYQEIIQALTKNKSIIIKVTLLSTLFIFLLLFLVYPYTYRSPASILPPEVSPQFGGLGGLLGAQELSSLFPAAQTKANPQLYAQIILSRSAAEYVVKKHSLKSYFNTGNIYEAAEKLLKKTNTEINKEGILFVSVDLNTGLFPLFTSEKDSVKKLAAELSNSLIEALDIINKEKLTSRAGRAREYIETQLVNIRARMDSVEHALVEFQKIHKTISLPEQLTASIEAAAKLKSEIVKTEIELALLKPNLREDNRVIQQLNKKLNELNEQYQKMELSNPDYFLAFGNVPELGRELADLLREVKIQNEVYMLLQQQYYKEKIQENRDIPTVEVLDEAIPPLKPSSPRLIVNTILGGIFSFLLIAVLVLLKEKKSNIGS
jgi:uncharacterized protein involved in exopolysaccharide biosynthesis